MDTATVDNCRVDYCRVNVYRPDWDRIIQRVERLAGPVTTDVTRRRLWLGSQDSVTGWYSKNFADETVEMVIIPRSATRLALTVGVYVRLDAVGLTADAVKAGDETKTDGNEYYEVKGVKEHFIGDSFSHRECDLTLLPLHELV